MMSLCCYFGANVCAILVLNFVCCHILCVCACACDVSDKAEGQFIYTNNGRVQRELTDGFSLIERQHRGH